MSTTVAPIPNAASDVAPASVLAAAAGDHPKTGEQRRVQRCLRLDLLPEAMLDRVRAQRAAGRSWEKIELDSPDWPEWDEVSAEVLADFPERRLPHSTLRRWYDLRVEQVQGRQEKRSLAAKIVLDRLFEHGIANLQGALKNLLGEFVFASIAHETDAERSQEELYRFAKLLLAMDRQQAVLERLALERRKLDRADEEAKAEQRQREQDEEDEKELEWQEFMRGEVVRWKQEHGEDLNKPSPSLAKAEKEAEALRREIAKQEAAGSQSSAAGEAASGTGRPKKAAGKRPTAAKGTSAAGAFVSPPANSRVEEAVSPDEAVGGQPSAVSQSDVPLGSQAGEAASETEHPTDTEPAPANMGALPRPPASSRVEEAGSQPAACGQNEAVGSRFSNAVPLEFEEVYAASETECPTDTEPAPANVGTRPRPPASSCEGAVAVQ